MRGGGGDGGGNSTARTGHTTCIGRTRTGCTARTVVPHSRRHGRGLATHRPTEPPSRR